MEQVEEDKAYSYLVTYYSEKMERNQTTSRINKCIDSWWNCILYGENFLYHGDQRQSS